MRDAPRDDEVPHLASVSYLPWAVPGLEQRTDRPGATEAGIDRADLDPADLDPAGRWAATPDRASSERLERPAEVGRIASGSRNAGARPVARLDSRAGGSRRTTSEAGAGASGSKEPGAGTVGVGWPSASSSDEPEPGVERDARIDRLVIGRLRRSSLSVAEVRAVLTEHGLDAIEVDEWIERYERLGYLNDVRLAEQLVRSGAERRGRGSGAILAELTRRGVSAEATRAALDDLDPELERTNAFAVAERRARQLRGLDRTVAERRLTAFLQRRGYDSRVVRDAVTAALASAGS